MTTEITDTTTTRTRGWIFFDAECRFCVARRRRWGRIVERRGFVWLPLQTSGTAERLGVTDAQLRAEMWLQLADGRKYGGVDAWGVAMRRVWWLWPLGVVLGLPGVHAGVRVLYRWIARNRRCLGGTCKLPGLREGAPSAPREVTLECRVVLPEKLDRPRVCKRPRRRRVFLELP